MNPSNIGYKWSQVCKKLTSKDASKLLHRFVSEFKYLSQHSGKNSNDSFRRLLQNKVAHDILEGRKLSNSENLSFSESMEVLHRKLIELNKNSLLTTMDLSLSLNSYAKLYQNLSSNRSNHFGFTQISVNKLKRNVLDLLDIANKNINYMNHHDLSLVLNCMAKMDINHEEFFNSTNDVLYNALQEYYRLKGKSNESELSNNLIKNITPLSVSLLLNSFSKSSVELNQNVLEYFVNEYVPKNIDKFAVHQLILTLHSFNKFKVDISTCYEIIKASDIKLGDSISEYSMKLISTALYTFAIYEYFPRFSMPNIVSYLKSTDFNNCSELELCNIYYAISNINARYRDLIQKLNDAVLSRLDCYSVQAVVGIFFSLSKLDYKNLLIEKNQESFCLEDKFFNQFSRLLKIDFSNLSSTNVEHNIPVLIHPINICFGCSTNFNLDPRVYNYFLKILVYMLETNKKFENNIRINNIEIIDINNKISNINNYIISRYKDELIDDDKKFKSFCYNIGNKGINQLYCILLHILYYVKGGLESIDYSVLRTVNSLMDRITFKYSNSKNKIVLEEEKERQVNRKDRKKMKRFGEKGYGYKYEYDRKEENKDQESKKLGNNQKEENEENKEYYLREEFETFSKIQTDVYKTICKIFEKDENRILDLVDRRVDRSNLDSEMEQTQTIVYQEHIVTPYSVDIAVFKF